MDGKESPTRRKPTVQVRHMMSFSQGLKSDLDVGRGENSFRPPPVPEEDVDLEGPASYSAPPRPQTADVEIDSDTDFEEDDKMFTDAAQSSPQHNITGEYEKETFLFKDEQETKKEVDNKLHIIINYWRQRQWRKKPDETTIPIMLNQKQIAKRWIDVEKTREVQNKEWSVRKELNFIKRNFRQRRCKKFCKRHKNFKEKFDRCLEQYNIVIQEQKEYCHCGLEKDWHSRDVLAGSGREDPSWSIGTHTERVMPWNFGNVDMPGNYSYLDLPEGTRRFIRLDDLTSQPRQVLELLTDYWNLRKPNMVISITGGDMAAMFANTFLHKQFREGIIKTAVNTKSWVITEGLHAGSAKEIGDIFQEDLKRSEWSEVEDHANIPLIAIGPWGVVEGQQSLAGIYVGSNEAKYNFIALEGSSGTLHNTLDPYHTVYLLADDGTYGRYNKEPKIRNDLEKYIKRNTTIEMLGTKGVPTPVVILVLGGDTFTLEKLAAAVAEDTEISVVLVNGSGPIANMLAAVYKLLETVIPCSDKRSVREWTDKEEDTLKRELIRYKKEGLLSTNEDEIHLKTFMKGRYLAKVFGTENGDQVNLDKAILGAIFGGVTEISAQLNLTLALDRVGIAREAIIIESRKDELRTEGLVENALFVSMETGKADFTQLLLDQDIGGQLDFKKFVTIRRLQTLHKENLNPTYPMAKILRSLTKKDVYGSDELKDDNLLPQVGRIIYLLMGDNYRLLYQEKEYRCVCDDQLPWALSGDEREEAVWHIFFWAVLSNRKDIAELFLFESNCKIGLALIAFKMLKELAKVAEVWHETELVEDLEENARYFQDLATETLDNLYEMNREEAYANIVSLIPFHWGHYTTPLAIADDAVAKRFLGHACCQTFLNLLWWRYMDLDTAYWKLIPLFAFFPFLNIPLITFDKKNLSFGSYKEKHKEEEKEHKEQLDVDDPQDGNPNVPNASANKGDNDSLASEAGVIAQSNAKKNRMKRFKFAWFCVKNYYTSPLNVFLHSFSMYIIFLGLFTHFVLSELKPIGSGGANELTAFEWITYIWVGSITFQELAQLISRKSSGPLYNLKWIKLEPQWKETWHWHERIKFVLGIHKVSLWLSDRWNKIDAMMIIMFTTSVILRFTLPNIDFAWVRLFFCVTLILYYIRLLRFGYIIQSLGPRIITIKEMMKDLFLFILILSIFVISFGVAFQALLYPNKSASWDLLVDVLWRSYWQMYGELLIDDPGMGRDVGNLNCTSDRDLANQHPDQYEYCYSWMPVLLLAVYMMITNILLLNLLIAIFSNSFERIENEALAVWRYHLYDLVHEYYQQVWLPPPLNLLCHIANVALWSLKWPRRWMFLASMTRNKAKVHAELEQEKDLAGKDAKQIEFILKNETEYAVKRECFSFFYYDNQAVREESIDHFRQEEYMRNEDLEEMAYKKYMRQLKKNKEKQSKIKDMLKLQSTRLLTITQDLSQVKHQTSGEQHKLFREPSSLTMLQSSKERNKRSDPDLQTEVDKLNCKMDHLNSRLENLTKDITPILQYVKTKSSKRKKTRNNNEVDSLSEV